ncbi:hypothetical protein NLJ89_g11418 [Agrocybe chaxingu]|uniref:F-box domain-containing protein n=1 Tax=Agrocybe chaxingu TaxID=84603 RepID=A0A9W8JNR9_9AGAR|nr:hypothetical protein NLJ89_g11418 [Agrocybe chaxingu]
MANPTGGFSRPEIPWGGEDFKMNYPDNLVPFLQHNSPITSQIARDRIHEILTDTEQSLAVLERELSSVDAQILALQQRRQELVQQATPGRMTLDACKKALAPIRNIPLEIFQEIVLHALPPQPNPTLKQAPMSLSHVCRDWRNALLTFPHAWQELFLEVDITTIYQRKPQNTVNSWFRRAGHLPLSFYIHFHHDGPHWHQGGVEMFNSIVARFFNGINSFSPRIRHLGLSADQVLDYFLYFEEPVFPTPNIHSLMLHMNRPISRAQYVAITNTDERESLFAFKKLLKLQKLSLDDPITFHGPGRLMFPWSQLTDLDLTRDEADEFDDESSTDDSDEEEDATLAHHHLEDLRVCIHDEGIRHNWCFEACRFPRLRLLHLSHDYEFVDDGSDGEVGQDFPPEFSSLQALSVEGDWSESPESLQQLYTAAASITKLSVMVDLDTLSVLKTLTPRYCSSTDEQWSDEDSNTSVKEPELIMPNLSSLTLVVGAISDDELPEILKWLELMLTFRSTAGHFKLLKKFRLLSRSWDDTVLRRIQSLLECYSEFDFEVGGLWHLHRGTTTCAEWKAEITHRMSRRAIARARGLPVPIRE